MFQVIILCCAFATFAAAQQSVLTSYSSARNVPPSSSFQSSVFTPLNSPSLAFNSYGGPQQNYDSYPSRFGGGGGLNGFGGGYGAQGGYGGYQPQYGGYGGGGGGYGGLGYPQSSYLNNYPQQGLYGNHNLHNHNYGGQYGQYGLSGYGGGYGGYPSTAFSANPYGTSYGSSIYGGGYGLSQRYQPYGSSYLSRGGNFIVLPYHSLPSYGYLGLSPGNLGYNTYGQQQRPHVHDQHGHELKAKA